MQVNISSIRVQWISYRSFSEDLYFERSLTCQKSYLNLVLIFSSQKIIQTIFIEMAFIYDTIF